MRLKRNFIVEIALKGITERVTETSISVKVTESVLLLGMAKRGLGSNLSLSMPEKGLNLRMDRQ